MAMVFRVMQVTFIILASLYTATSSAAITNPDMPQASRLRITNQCDKTLWIQQDYKITTQDPVVVKVPAGMSYDYTIPEIGLPATRFWPKSDCNAQGYNCTVGESVGVPEAEKKGFQHGPYAPDINSKFEATWGCMKSIFDHNPALCASNPSNPSHHLDDQTWWNGSAVDGYTFPYAIHVSNHNNTCTDLRNGQTLPNPGVDCGQLSVSSCPTDVNLSTEGKFNVINGVDVTRINLQWLADKTQTPIGCFSPCSKLTTAQGSDNGKTGGGWHTILGGLIPQSPEAQMYCCPTPPVTPEACSAGPAARSSYSTSVHLTQKCDAYTYAYDDGQGLAKCGSQTQFEVVFCPKAPPPQPPVPVITPMKIIIPSTIQAQVDGTSVNNNQVVSIANGSTFNLQDNPNTICTLAVNAQFYVTPLNGSLCSQLKIDNAAKSITFTNNTPPTTSVNLQFNMNTSAGITAYLNDTQLVNATPIDSAGLPKQSILKAYQDNKQGNCTLTIMQDAVQKGSGTLCQRLNIVNEGKSKIHIYLPADIPNMGSSTPPVTKPKYIVFGMDPDMYADFKNNIVTNDSKIAISSLDNVKTIDLIAYQNQKSASCIIGKSGDTLSIIPNTGLLCSGGLVLITQNNGDYFIGLPNPLPVPLGTTAYGLGIAQGMSITINKQKISWNSKDKTVYIPQGVTNIKIIGNNSQARTCAITLSKTKMTWPATVGCKGLVLNSKILYFSAF